MDLLGFVRLGTPVLILGMLIVLERINLKIGDIQDDIQEIKKGITWSDTCNAIHEEVNRRFGRLEKKVFNGGMQHCEHGAVTNVMKRP